MKTVIEGVYSPCYGKVEVICYGKFLHIRVGEISVSETIDKQKVEIKIGMEWLY